LAKFFMAVAAKKRLPNEPWGRDRIGSRLSLMCPSLGQLLNFPEEESFHGIDKFTRIAIDPCVVGGRHPQPFPSAANTSLLSIAHRSSC
jgi:hypothetical protein